MTGIQSITVSSSLFFECCAPQTNHDNGGAGGIYAYSIKRSFSLSSSDFISCSTGSSGGGIYFDCNSNPRLNIEIITDCRCVQCRSQDTSPDGGGMCLFERYSTIHSTECLFCECTTTGSGGGLNFYYGTNCESYPIKYCFFAGNAGGYAKDVFLWTILPENGYLVFTCCFTTSESNRIGYSMSSAYKSKDNWIPLGVL